MEDVAVDGANLPAAPAAPTAVVHFNPPMITAAMMPQPDPSIEKQSAEKWFKVFHAVGDSLIGIYHTAGQEVVGQRQALATIPTLLNRNESEKQLSTRIISECTTIKEAEDLVIKTIGDLESECQAAEAIFTMKRGTKSLEDFYALLIEKDKKAKLGATNIMKKIISELPESIKPNIQRKFKEFRRFNGDDDIAVDQIEQLYAKSRELYNTKYKQKEEVFIAGHQDRTEKRDSAEGIESIVQKQNENIKELHDKLDAFLVQDKYSTQGTNVNRRRPTGVTSDVKNMKCFHCNKIGHMKKDCWSLQAELRKEEIRKSRRNKSEPSFCLLEKDNAAVVVKGYINKRPAELMIDTGAGPCVVGLSTIQKLKIEEDMCINDQGRSLHGLGEKKVLGTIVMNVRLTPSVEKKQLFNVVDDLGDVILLGRKFLASFDSLEIDWKSMQLKINGKFLVSGNEVVQGGETETRVYVAQGNVMEETTEEEIKKQVSNNKYLNSHEKQELEKLLIEHQDVFIQNPKNPPRAKLVSHVIDTGVSQPCRDKMRRIPPQWHEEINLQIKEMIKNGICRKSNSPWSSQVLLVKKKDGSMRFVIDYRKLNDLTIRDEYPMPNIKDLIDKLQGSKYFSCMDLPSAYWHIPMEETSIIKTAFDVPYGKYEMLRMPYGLKNAGSTQQRHMDQVLEPVTNTEAYIDNIFTHSREFLEHIKYLREALEGIRANNLSLRLDKCEFAKKKVTQFGLDISSEGITPSKDNILKIQQYPRPNTIKEVRRFLGMTNYYREFVSKFAAEAEPLQELLRKDTRYCWTEAREKAFNEIKRLITNSCLLSYPDWNKTFVIEIDGSKTATGGILSQISDDGKQTILAYHSSTLDKSQRNYSPTEMECWAAISACRKFRTHIKGAPKLILQSDHEPLKWLRKQRDPRGKFSRWIMELEQYNYEFQYKSGVENVAPDALSRIEIGKIKSDTDDTRFFEDHIYLTKVRNIEDENQRKDLLRQEQIRDPAINIAREQLIKENNIRIGRYKSHRQLFMQDGLLVKSGRIVVPHSLKYQIVKDFHSANHWGIKNTQHDIAVKYYWPNMRGYISEYCNSCDTCLRTKHSNLSIKAPLKPQKWDEFLPRQAIALDIATMVPSTEGYKYVLLIVDGMSKFVELCPLRNITAKTVVKNVKREWIARHGIPHNLLTDQGQQVDGEEIREMCEEYNIKKRHSTPYHPEGDGISERPIGTMKSLFRSKLLDGNIHQNKWPDLLPATQLNMNTKKHASTGKSPFQLMYGQEHEGNDVIQNVSMGENNRGCNVNPLIEENNYIRTRNIDSAKIQLQKTAGKMKEQYDKKISDSNLKVGDLVYVKRNFTRKGESKKLSTLYHALSIIIEKQDPIYLIQNINNRKQSWIHHNHLRKKNILDNENMITVKKNKHLTTINEGEREMSGGDDFLYDDEDTPENITSILGDEIPDVETTPAEVTAAADKIPEIQVERHVATTEEKVVQEGSSTNEEQPIGRQIREDGTVKSSRLRKTNRKPDFEYT